MLDRSDRPVQYFSWIGQIGGIGATGPGSVGDHVTDRQLFRYRVAQDGAGGARQQGGQSEEQGVDGRQQSRRHRGWHR